MGSDDNTGNIRTKKAVIRKQILAKRRELTDEERAQKSKIICERFLESPEYRSARTILLYKAYNNETDTDPIFERAIADGKTVAYPVSHINDGEPDLTFYVINSHEQLTKGYKGIQEPCESARKHEFTKTADICIVPAVAYDKKCHRIGYGKAFYDRFIRLNAPKKVIGLAYDIQMVDDFEPEDSDRAVDMVITDLAVYNR